MQKITKTKVKSILQRLPEGETAKIYFTTNKTHLAGYKNWVEPIEMELNNDLDEFEKTVQEFKYAFCNSIDGNWVHYYVK